MENVDMLIAMALLLILAGAFSGMLAGLLGVGGGIVLVPAFFFIFSTLGYDGPQLMQLCLGTSLATIIFTSLRSLLAHHKRAAVDWPILGTWAPGLVIGAVVGVLVAAALRSDVLQFIFSGLALSIGLYLSFGRASWQLGAQMPGLAMRSALSQLVGFLSVLLGIGGGSLGVPIMTLFAVPIHRAVATAAGFGVIIAVPSVIGFMLVSVENAPPLSIGAVNFGAFAIVVAMTMVTAPVGARLAHRTNPERLRRLFGLFLIVVAANMLRKLTLAM